MARRKSKPPPAEKYEPLVPDYAPQGHTCTSISEKISAIVLERPTYWRWLALFGFGNALLAMFGGVIVYLLLTGVGIWGINIPVGWGFTITDFVWWIGIGHAGTLISAILLLMHQKWRTSINRIAEAMTIFGVMCAGMFPLLHLGRPWFFYWLLPYPNTMRLWPQFRSALVWDVFAVSTYFLVSLIFWYLGMIPDLACLRDRAKGIWARRCYGVLALGWRNSARHWHRYETSYLLLGGLATPLVVSVHSVVSSDFAISLEPAWHETVFPPYFVAGAIFSGFAMVLILCICLRHLYGLKEFIKMEHLSVMGKIIVATSLFTSYGYLSEQFVTWMNGETYDRYVYWYRLTGFDQYAYVTWTLFTCNTLVPQLLWIPALRRSELALFLVSIDVLVGMWLERYMIITSSLSRDFLTSSWGIFRPTIWDFLTFFGSIGLFLVAFMLFCRFLPMMSMSEMRGMLPGAHGHPEGY
ncbi:MAG TPA: NrfD/PsrC family molybdoenzyme membrane anchor subunit [Pirellulales bacterium]|jgi:molybdopterin-containing oxidoreductase family membrane subunit|nr:NrfD/PsrC family molybdoenzyme membrane anchor subunit [Pirellulales bacterium]